MTIKTPNGILRVDERNDTEYQGLNVYLNNELITVIEHNPIKNKIQVCIYESDNDEPFVKEL